MSIRYARQEALWGEEGQRKLSEAHVAVIGAGGLEGIAAVRGGRYYGKG